jgi:protein-S-isoprenylcysteine O-methyltransferase Ste14
MNMPSSIFTSNYAAIGFVIAIVCFFIAEQIGAVIIPTIRRGGAKVQRRQRNVGSNIMVYVSWMAVLSVSAILASKGIAPLPDWVYYLGIVLMLVGIAFRQWAIAVLGRYFSGVIGVQKEQKVVKSGPYHLIRHPSYTGVLIFYAGMGLAVQSWAAVLIATAIFGIVYGYRMFLEEKVLISEFGNSYVEYMKRTKRVIPKVV